MGVGRLVALLSWVPALSGSTDWRQGRDMVLILVGVTGCVPQPTGLTLVTLFSLSVSIEDRPFLWMVVKSQTYYPEHILAYGSGKARYALVVGSGSFWTD